MIAVIIYVIGIPIGYILTRSSIKQHTGSWTTFDRGMGLFISLASWVNILPYFIMKCRIDRKASW